MEILFMQFQYKELGRLLHINEQIQRKLRGKMPNTKIGPIFIK